MEFKCQICGKVYDNVRDYAKCAERCAIQLEEELEKKNRKEALLAKKEIEIKKIYNDLKKAIDEYYNTGGAKLIKSSLSIGDKPADTCGCNCKKPAYKFDNKWYGTTPKWFSIPNDVKVEYYNKAEDLKKSKESVKSKKVDKKIKGENMEVFLEDLLKTLLDIDEPKQKTKKDIKIESFYDNSLKDVWNFLDDLAKKYDE